MPEDGWALVWSEGMIPTDVRVYRDKKEANRDFRSFAKKGSVEGNVDDGLFGYDDEDPNVEMRLMKCVID